MDINIKKIAQLARLEIEDDKLEKFNHDFAAILNYFEKIQKVNVAKVKPMLSAAEENKNVYREDVADDLGQDEKEKMREAFLARAPQRKDNYLKVKSILK